MEQLPVSNEIIFNLLKKSFIPPQAFLRKKKLQFKTTQFCSYTSNHYLDIFLFVVKTKIMNVLSSMPSFC